MIFSYPNHPSPATHFLSSPSPPELDTYSCDEFRMYAFKIRPCRRWWPHDWTECPYAHPGEKATRRDPRTHHYSSTSCAGFRRGACRRGESCEFSHGVFECWLHPERYRTQRCKDGVACRRRVCFFAHTPEELRVPEVTTTSVVSPHGLSSLEEVLEFLRMLQVGELTTSTVASAEVELVGSAGIDVVWDEPVERVESGKGVREKFAEKLRESSLEWSE